ncbi:MAG: hypothetical protein ABFD89_03650 [Bryobacteraceae bacterium]
MNTILKYEAIASTTVITDSASVVKTISKVEAPSDVMICLCPSVVITSAEFQILPAHIDPDDAAAADWMTVALDADFKPASLGGAVVSGGGVGKKGISELTANLWGYAHLMLPPCRTARLRITAAEAGTIKGSIAWKSSDYFNSFSAG